MNSFIRFSCLGAVICVIVFSLLGFCACSAVSGENNGSLFNGEQSDAELGRSDEPAQSVHSTSPADLPSPSTDASDVPTALPSSPASQSTPASPSSPNSPSLRTPSPESAPSEPPKASPSSDAHVRTPVPEALRTPAPGTPEEKHVVYMTFDDGPCPLSYELLDILDRYNVKATFFTVGYFVDRYPDVVREAEARGHLIACHTYSHDYAAVYSSAQDFMDDVHRWEEAVERALGHLPEQVIIRFPGGSKMGDLDKSVRSEIMRRLKQEGYKWYDWNCGNNDAWPEGNVDGLPLNEYLMQSYEKTIRWAFKSSEPCIFLAHETKRETIDTISLVIEGLIRRGAEFRTLDECPF